MKKITRRNMLQTGAAGLAGAALVQSASAQGIKRPAVQLPSQEKFDPRSIAAYKGTHDAAYRHIEANIDAHVQQLQRWVRQPSVSAQSKGIAEMANLLRNDLRELGFKEAELVPTSGHPGVWGYYDAGAPKTLLVYMMYDVQPVEAAGWQVDPFAGALVENEVGQVLMARGATNQKGPERAFLNALSSIIAVNGKLPVNLMVAAEGEEELGSPHYPEIVTKYESPMRSAAGAIFPFNSQERNGRVSMPLGVKGIIYFELISQGGKHGGPSRAEVHSSTKAGIDSPVWRLVQALSSLTSRDGNTILAPNYYDAIRQPNREEAMLANALLAEDTPENVKTQMQALGIERWADGMSANEAQMQMLFGTTLNIAGLHAGYTEEGVKTILPHRGFAKLDSRLVPDQNPQQQLALIRKHLDANGFTDVEMRTLSAYPPAQTSVDAALVKAGIGVYNKLGYPPVVSPRLAGSAPYYQFTDRLKLPMIPVGLGLGFGAHAPNEYMVIRPKQGSRVAGLAEIEKAYVDFLFALAA